MNYNLFSRTKQTASRNNQHNVYGNPHNNASGGYTYLPKTDGVLNRIHKAYQYESPTQNYDVTRQQGGNQQGAYQPQNDYHFYQGNYEMPEMNAQQQGFDLKKPGNYYGQEEHNPYANQDWRQRSRQARQADVHFGAGQWQNTVQNYQTFNNWQNFEEYTKPAERPNPKNQVWQPYGRKAANHQDRQENLEFKYRLRPDGQIFVNNRPTLIYSKNMIPDISAFSRSEKSISIKRRKRSMSDSDLAADISSDQISEDIDNMRRKRAVKGVFPSKTKSQADAEYSGLANIKIEGLIQRKLGLKQQDKKTGGPGITEKVSNGNSGSPQRPQGAAAIAQKVVVKKTMPGKPRQGQADKANQPKNNQAQEVPKFESYSSYNRDELVATLQDLIKTGKLNQSKVHFFEKFDDDLKKVVKYVRINVGEITEYNDHFISIKPEAAHNATKDAPNKKEQETHEHKRVTGTALAAKVRPSVGGEFLVHQNKASFYQQPMVQYPQAEVCQKSAEHIEDCNFDGQQLSLVEQAMHKTMTGKLQRNIRKMTDEEKVALFKLLKGSLHELSTNQYGRYVLVLLLKTNITAIVDAMVSYFDKRGMDLIKHKNGLLFSQSLIDLKFRDVRLRRCLKRIDGSLEELMAEQHAPLVVLTYANQLPPSDMEDFVEYCKKEYRVCIDNPIACRVFAKVFGKVSDVDRLEIELKIKTIMPQIFDGGYGKELVEMFFTKADTQNQLPLKKVIFANLLKYLTHEDYEYFFAKVIEQKKADLIDTLMTNIFKGDFLSDNQVIEVLNNSTGYRTILSFFTLSSMTAKDIMRVKLIKLRESHGSSINNYGNKVITLCDNYFSTTSK